VLQAYPDSVLRELERLVLVAFDLVELRFHGNPVVCVSE